MRRTRGRQVLVVVVVLAVLAVAFLPALVAYRYTAPSQRMTYVRRPWRGWAFVWAAIAVPGDSQLKTSGMALRKAEWIFKGTAVDPREVQLLFVPSHKPYTFTHSIDSRSVTSTITPSYRFVWQVQGVIDTVSDRADTIVAMLDYDTGRLLYDVRDDLRPSELVPEATSSPQPEPSPSGSP